MRSLLSRSPAALLLLPLLAACGDGGGGADGVEWSAVHDTIGDTVVVRTVAGSVWGEEMTLVPELTIGELEGADEYLLGDVQSLTVAGDGTIYLFDGQAKALRTYGPDGAYLGSIGREGGGPGEYKQPDGGLAVLPDGRILLRDPGNARINIYSRDGETLGALPIRGGWFTSLPLYTDTAGRVYHRTTVNPEAPVDQRRQGLLVFGEEGAQDDTLVAPDFGFEPPELSVQGGSEGRRISMSRGVPFAPDERWTFHPHGYFVHGISNRYAFDLLRPGGVLRIEREASAVPVDPDEKAAQQEQVEASFRGVDPGWRWNGPPIPDTKPPYVDLMAGQDGRIWVQVSQPGERIPEEERAEAEGPAVRGPGGATRANTAPRWREPMAFDVFEPDGRYLGRVRTPRGFSRYPTPTIRGDRVWGIMRDEMGVQYLVRWRVQPPGSEGGPERTEVAGG